MALSENTQPEPGDSKQHADSIEKRPIVQNIWLRIDKSNPDYAFGEEITGMSGLI